ncbi:MAG: hypothetical protein BWY05_00371 [Euryarchaeota archaeon ADurb.Bin165]|nr:MAG: hypothetical protein BWY05_00371 [Euryarchaeota archaeon ADurb.Bin165]
MLLRDPMAEEDMAEGLMQTFPGLAISSTSPEIFLEDSDASGDHGGETISSCGSILLFGMPYLARTGRSKLCMQSPVLPAMDQVLRQKRRKAVQNAEVQDRYARPPRHHLETLSGSPPVISVMEKAGLQKNHAQNVKVQVMRKSGEKYQSIYRRGLIPVCVFALRDMEKLAIMVHQTAIST